MRLVEVDVCPSGGRRLGRASHGVQLPFDQAAGGSFDAGVRDFHHELGKLIGWKRGHVLFLGFLEDRPNSTEGVREDQSGVDPVGHDLVESLAQSFHCFEAAFGLDWAKQLDDHRGGDFRERRCFQVWENVQRERAPNVFGVGRGDGILLQLEPGGRHVLEGVFRLCSFGLPFVHRVALSDRCLGQAARSLPRLSSGRCASESSGYVPKSHVDPLLGYGIAVVEIPQHRAIVRTRS